MRNYMPGPHARFLDAVEAMSNIRPYIELECEKQDLRDAYNSAVAALSELRDKHIQLVAKYIVIPSRTPTPVVHRHRINLASTTTKLADQDVNTKDLVGTGGTKLIPFLRQSRDETAATSLVWHERESTATTSH